MKYSITNNTTDNWEIIADPNGEFLTLQDAKNELIEICKTHIVLEKLMIKSVKDFKLLLK